MTPEQTADNVKQLREIPLTQGKFAIIDNDDYDIISKFKWYAKRGNNTWYAANTSINDFGEKIYISMQKILINPPVGMVVDHINGNGLDNTRCNLRICTPLENSLNKRKCRGVSKYKGVHWDGRTKSWQCSIGFNYKRIFIGRFKNEDDAALAYNQKASELFGQFANLNAIAALKEKV